MDKEFEVIDVDEDSLQRVRLLKKSPYNGIVYQYGKVSFKEEDDSLRVSFEYDVFENPNNHNTDTEEFVNYIGAFLMQTLEETIFYNNYYKQKNEV